MTQVETVHRTGQLTWYASAAVLVRLADEGARVVLALLALQRTGSATLGGMLVAVLLVPHVVAAPVVGMLVDRSGRPSRLIAGAAGLFGASLAFAAVALGRAPTGVVVLVLLVGGCCGPALTGALTSQLSVLMPSERLPRAFGIDSLTYNTAGIVGPTIAAVLAGATSAAIATVALGCSAGVGALLIAALGIRRTRDRLTAINAAELLAGTAMLLREPVLRTITATTCIGQLGAGALPVIVAVAATRAHDPAAAGWLLTAMAAGGLIGSLLWTWRPATPRRAPAVVMVGLIATGIPIVIGAGFSSLPLLIVSFTVSGIANGPLFGALLLTRQTRSPDRLRSQIFALSAGAKITATAAGAALAGTLAHTATTMQLAFAGAMPVLAGIVGGGLVLRHSRTLRLDQHARAQPRQEASLIGQQPAA